MYLLFTVAFYLMNSLIFSQQWMPRHYGSRGVSCLEGFAAMFQADGSCRARFQG